MKQKMEQVMKPTAFSEILTYIQEQEYEEMLWEK